MFCPKMGYKNEMKDFKMTIFAFLMLLVMSTFYYFVTKCEFPFFYMFLPVIICCVIVFFENLKNYMNYKKNQKIKSQGQRLDGHINSFECGVTGGGTDRRTRAYYRLVVTYINPSNNQHCIYVTPKINFNLFNDLGSRMCSVYLLNNEVYVTDFVVKSANQECVWEPEIVEQYNPKELIRQENNQWIKIALFALLMYFLFMVFGL